MSMTSHRVCVCDPLKTAHMLPKVFYSRQSSKFVWETKCEVFKLITLSATAWSLDLNVNGRSVSNTKPI